MRPRFLACTPRTMELPSLRWGKCMCGVGVDKIGWRKNSRLDMESILTLRPVRDQTRTIHYQFLDVA